MQDRFDPYLQWLEIPPAERPPDHYQLLQLDRYESDAETVTLAADRAMAGVRGQRPGEHVAAWQALLDELAAAKACLTDAAKKNAYDNRLQENFASPPTASPRNDPLSPSIAASSPEALFPPNHRAETTSPDSPPPDTAVAASVPPAMPVDVPRHHDSSGAGAGDVANPLSDPMAPVGHASDSQQHLGATAKPAAPVPQDPRPLLTPVTQPIWSRHAAGFVVALAGGLLLAALVALIVSKSKTGPDRSVADQPADTEADQPTEKSIVAAASKRPETSPRPSKPSPPPVSRPATIEPKPAPEPPSQNVPPPSSSKPTPKPESKPPPVAPKPSPPPEVDPRPSAVQVAAFNGAVKRALAALQRRDAALTNRNLIVAEKNAISQDQRDRLGRVRKLQHYAGEFFKAVRAGYDALQGDEELVIGGEVMAVVDCTPKEITLRRRGRNQVFAFDAMPDSLSLTLANRWFDETDPTSKVFVGAFQALRGKIDVARELWMQARGDGVSEVDFVLPVLDEIPPPGKGKRR